MRSLIASIVAAAVLSSAARPAEVAEALNPSSPWNVDYRDDSCRLARVFGTGDDMVFLLFDRFSPTQRFNLTIAGKPFRNLVNRGRATLQFGPNEEIQTVDFLAGELGKNQPAMILKGGLRFDAVFPDPLAPGAETSGSRVASDSEWLSAERIAAVRLLTITKPLHKPVRLALGSMGAAFAASDTCLANMVKRWGLDPDRLARASKQAAPISDPRQWLTSADYPKSAILHGQQGVVQFRLNIDEMGNPSGCHIQQSTRPPEFDEVVCRTLSKRARFSPALDKSGAPMPAVFLSAVIFQIP